MIGNSAGQAISSGSYNLQIGSYVNATGGITTGSYNVIIGNDLDQYKNALFSQTGSNNIYIADGQGNLRIKFDGAVSGQVYTPFILDKDTTAGITGIAAPVAGMMMYDTDQNVIAFYNGSGWQKLSFTAL